MCCYCRSVVGSSDPLPTAMLVSLPASQEQAVGPGLAAETAAATGSTGLEAAEGEDNDCPDPLPLCHRGVGKVHNGEGGNDLLMLYCRCPQPIKERCHPLGHTHCVSLCMHRMEQGCRRKEWGDH